VDLRFSKLEKLKLNNWKDVVCEEVKQPVARRLKKVTVKKPTKSSLRTMIAGMVFSVFGNTVERRLSGAQLSVVSDCLQYERIFYLTTHSTECNSTHRLHLYMFCNVNTYVFMYKYA
jgi:hypothetical protein